MLMQKGKDYNDKLIPISFFSKSFTPTQQRYSTLERELLGILLALKSNYLLLSEMIEVLTDHKALVSINANNNMLNTRILKFIETLSTYPLEIKYITGKSNFADFISRFSVTNQPALKLIELNSLGRFPIEVDEDDKIFESRKLKNFGTINDDELMKLKELIQIPNVLNIPERNDNYDAVQEWKDVIPYFVVNRDILYYVHGNILLKVISVGQCIRMMEEEHKKFHGTPNLLIDIMIMKKLFHPKAQLIAIDVIKN